MKFFLPAIATFLGICFIPLRTASTAPNGSDPGMYQWTDESGTVNFSDNPIEIPGEYEKGAKKRDSIKREASPHQAENSKKYRPPNWAGLLHGGHDENWWRSRFAELHAQIRMKKDTISKKQAKLKVVHFRMAESDAIGAPTAMYGSPQKNRREYKDLYYEIKADEESVTALEKELESLAIEASRTGVPFDWQQDKGYSGE